MTSSVPTCYIIAGPNGAGKTTFALHYLPNVAQCRNFVNADLIAAGLSPLSPEREKITASRLLLKEIKAFIALGETFAFETTLSGKSYLRLIRQLQSSGWKVELFYLWLPSVESSITRVKERVAHGGHHIPINDIKRRFPRSLDNLINRYAPLCDQTYCYDNSYETPQIIFRQNKVETEIVNDKVYQYILKEITHAR